MDFSVLLLTSKFMSADDILNIPGILDVQKLELIKHGSIERNPFLSSADKESIRKINRWPPSNLNDGLRLKVFHEEQLKHMIANNPMLDPRTKVQLLLGQNNDLYDWFVHTFVTNTPPSKPTRNIDMIIKKLDQEADQSILLWDKYLLKKYGPESIKVYNIRNNQVVAFATSDRVYYLVDEVTYFFTESFVLDVSHSIYKRMEHRYTPTTP